MNREVDQTVSQTVGRTIRAEIRELRDEDIETLSRIESEAFSMPWSANDFHDLLTRDYCMYLVAVAEGETVGCCGMTVLCGEGNIDNVVVAKHFRNRGIASAMLKELLARGEAVGVGDFTLEVRVSNKAAIHIYEKLGFVSEGIRPRFYERPVEDANIMWRRRQGRDSGV